MPLPNTGGGYQIGDGNLGEMQMGIMPAPVTATATATLTVADLLNGMILGSPGASAATYTLPTVALLEATLVNAKVGSFFDVIVTNVNGSASGVITLAVGTGWTIVGLATVVATAGTSQAFRARKTGVGTWTLYRLG
jgi:hypothetical protein